MKAGRPQDGLRGGRIPCWEQNGTPTQPGQVTGTGVSGCGLQWGVKVPCAGAEHGGLERSREVGGDTPTSVLRGAQQLITR